MKNVSLVQLNEINFDWVSKYIKQGKLPFFKKLLTENQLVETKSEKEYENLEPWVQWVSVYTGKKYAEHKVYRLGDIKNFQEKTLFEDAKEVYGSTAAYAPMNFDNKHDSLDIFVPDPWTNAVAKGTKFHQKFADAAKQLVNDNSSGKMEFKSVLTIVEAVIRFCNPKDYFSLFGMGLKIVSGKSWYKAIIFDYLLFKVYLKDTRKADIGFSTVFLNAGAHIQHHYMFNSKNSTVAIENPNWYIGAKHDPVLDIYSEYDHLLKELFNKNIGRIVIATGLSQEPYETEHYYWRLKDHASFLSKLGLSFEKVSPRMTRDFLVEFENLQDLESCYKKLSDTVDQEGRPFFKEIDKREDSLFVTLTYPHEIDEKTTVSYAVGENLKCQNEMVFVALKNGMHNSTGYLIDTKNTVSGEIELEEIRELLLN